MGICTLWSWGVSNLVARTVKLRQHCTMLSCEDYPSFIPRNNMLSADWLKRKYATQASSTGCQLGSAPVPVMVFQSCVFSVLPFFIMTFLSGATNYDVNRSVNWWTVVFRRHWAGDVVMGAFKGPRLLDLEKTPAYLQFNRYVLTGYRPVCNADECLRSLFYMHNELGNIYTHGKFRI